MNAYSLLRCKHMFFWPLDYYQWYYQIQTHRPPGQAKKSCHFLCFLLQPLPRISSFPYYYIPYGILQPCLRGELVSSANFSPQSRAGVWIVCRTRRGRL